MFPQDFTYKNYQVSYEIDEEEDCIKIFHFFKNIDTGKTIFGAISPYDSSQLTCRMYIDAGLPERSCYGNWCRETLAKELVDKAESEAIMRL